MKESPRNAYIRAERVRETRSLEKTTIGNNIKKQNDKITKQDQKYDFLTDVILKEINPELLNSQNAIKDLENIVLNILEKRPMLAKRFGNAEEIAKALSRKMQKMKEKEGQER